jgi:hypothetical protein
MQTTTLAALALAVTVNATAQSARHNLLFKQGQTKISSEQERQLTELAASLDDGDRVTVYPLTYDSVFDRLVYSTIARQQAAEIVSFTESIGFEHQGTPINFPSAYSGISVGVIIKYERPDFNVWIEPKSVNTLRGQSPPKTAQYFVIDPKRDTVITGDEGTKLLFEAGSLLSNEPVRIELREFYALGDLMKNDLPTVSNGRMIQTAGSIYLNATKNADSNTPVKLNQNKGVGIQFSAATDPGMQIFVKDPLSRETNWILPEDRPAEDWQMTWTLLDPDGSIVDQQTFMSREAWEQHLKNREADAKADEVSRDQLRAYGFGFINCDKFYDAPMVSLALPVDRSTLADHYLVYKNVRGVVKGALHRGEVDFGSVPANIPALLIAVSFFEGQAYYFESTITAGSDEQPVIDLQPVEHAFVYQQLALLK